MNAEDFKFIKPGEVRVRIAPSPTGPLHIGVARVSLFNYLFAKKYQGSFILRIEDTDIERSDPRFEKEIIENLKWLGIEWSEGPDIGGDYAPYRQSKRLEIYAKYIEKLLKEDKAYYCFCSEKDLESQKQYQMSIGKPSIYSGKCRNLPPETVKKYLAEGKPFIIRFKIFSQKLEFQDMVRGKIEFDASLIGDIAIAKDLASPLYNFAVVIDDFEMKISHVIRGEDHIPNTPKQILIQQALGFPRPSYAHLPLILGSDRTKLSKRHGATSISDYKKAGYLPESLINFMAFLGWNPGGEREVYSMASLIKEFSLERVQRGGAIFNIKRLDFLNGFYIRQKSIEKLTELCLPYLLERGLILPIWGHGPPSRMYAVAPEPYHVGNYKIVATDKIISFNYLKRIVSIYQERLKKISEISELIDFFFKDKLEYDKNLLKWTPSTRGAFQEGSGGIGVHSPIERVPEITDKATKDSLDKSRKVLSKIKAKDFTKENLEKILILEAEKFGQEIAKKTGLPAEVIAKAKNRGYLLWPLRVALTGKQASASPFEIAEILGKEKTLKRIGEARRLIKS